jgi:ectoine hydroxylase-related dioxygenase (phytanoyl-CoA dioxygenase family)
MSIREKITKLGFAVADSGLEAEEVDTVLRELEPLEPSLHAAGRGGIRDVLRISPPARRLVTHPSVRRVVEALLGTNAFAVRGVLFEKHSSANWKVPWHQDLTIAVRQTISAPGYGPWSEKAGVPHVQPPLCILEEMLTVRIHLDDCDSSNGPVRVFAGSHRSGRLSDAAIAAVSRSAEAVTCTCRRGGLLAMRPLLVHGSSAATVPSRRRVLHLDFASCSLAEGLEWSEQWRWAAAA